MTVWPVWHDILGNLGRLKGLLVRQKKVSGCGFEQAGWLWIQAGNTFQMMPVTEMLTYHYFYHPMTFFISWTMPHQQDIGKIAKKRNTKLFVKVCLMNDKNLHLQKFNLVIMLIYPSDSMHQWCEWERKCSWT